MLFLKGSPLGSDRFLNAKPFLKLSNRSVESGEPGLLWLPHLLLSPSCAHASSLPLPRAAAPKRHRLLASDNIISPPLGGSIGCQEDDTVGKPPHGSYLLLLQA